LKVVVIDDNAYDRKVICDSLIKEGYEVLEAENGSLGLDLIQEQSPDLIICDVRMPIMDGDELLETLRNSSNDMGIIPFIFISGFTNGEQKIDRLKKGADNFFEKPVDLELLSACVKSNLIGMERISSYMKRQLDSIADAVSAALDQDVNVHKSVIAKLGDALDCDGGSKAGSNGGVDKYVETIIRALHRFHENGLAFPSANGSDISRLDYMNFFLAEYEKRKSLATTANGEDLSWLLIFLVAKSQIQDEKLPMSDLYVSAPSAKSTINARVNSLIEHGVLHKEHDESDGRRQLISLSEKFHNDLLFHIDASIDLIKEKLV